MMAAGGHFHFDNNHNVSRIKGNSTLNNMTPFDVDRSSGSKVIALFMF
jgi:hypothetical protein